jgi:hypothetical protein
MEWCPMTMITIDSLIVGSRARVEVDPYAPNPLAEDCRQAAPAAYNAALEKAGPPPKLFTEGTADLPAFTAAGFDPAELMRLPALTRHFVASVADPATVHRLFEELTSDPYGRIDHPGFQDAILRVRDWASGRMDRDTVRLSWLIG